MFPFEESIGAANIRRRIFKKTVDADELIWHRDERNRTVKIIEARGWYLQFDDELPGLLVPGTEHKIHARSWHRIIRKTDCDDLIVDIIED